MATKIIAEAEEELNVRCKYLNQCFDVRKLLKMGENEKSDITYLNLVDQYHELCLSASPEFCRHYQNFEKQYKNIGIGI